MVEARRGELAGRELYLLRHRACVDTVSITADRVEIARQACRRYGKGRHAVALSFGTASPGNPVPGRINVR